MERWKWQHKWQAAVFKNHRLQSSLAGFGSQMHFLQVRFYPVQVVSPSLNFYFLASKIRIKILSIFQVLLLSGFNKIVKQRILHNALRGEIFIERKPNEGAAPKFPRFLGSIVCPPSPQQCHPTSCPKRQWLTAMSIGLAHESVGQQFRLSLSGNFF